MLSTPDLFGNESLAIAGNIGFWDNTAPLCFSPTEFLGRNMMGFGERVTASCGVGFSVDNEDFGRRGE